MNNEALNDQGQELEQEVAPYQDWAPMWLRGMMAFTAGCFLLDVGLRLLHIRIEWFIGMDTFSFSWVLAMFPLPVLAGVVIGLIYGFGGKYLAHFPPVIGIELVVLRKYVPPATTRWRASSAMAFVGIFPDPAHGVLCPWRCLRRGVPSSLKGMG